MILKPAVALAAALAAVVGLPAAANADPSGPRSSPITVACDNGVTYYGTVIGNGAWGPAHDGASTAMLIPVWFGPETDVVTDDAGNVLDTEVVPPRAKGAVAGHNKNATVTCSYSLSFSPAPDFNLSITGTVLGFVTPN
jgi:hypothetical protein